MSRKQYYSLQSYISYIATFKWRFLLVFGIFAIADTILVIIPIFIGQLVGALAQQPVPSDTAYLFAFILIACSVGHDLCWRTAEFLYLKFLVPKTYEYEDIIFHSVITKKYPYFVGKFTGKIGSHVGTIGREFREFVDQVCYTYADQLIKLPAIAIIMFTVNAYTGIVFVASVLIMFIVGRLTVRRSMETEQQETDVSSSMDGYVIDVIANFVSVKAFKKELTEFDQIQDKRQVVIKAAKRSFFWAIIFWGAMSFVVRYIIWPATILINIHLYLVGSIDLVQITTFLSVIVIFSDYIWGVIWSTSQFILKLARIEEAYQYLFGKRNVVTSFEDEQAKTIAWLSAPAPRFAKELELRELTFAYPDKRDHDVLSGINLTIQKNEKVGIVGKSGSGKTTLIKLLLGYYRVPSASMIIDGEPCNNEELVKLVSYVPQDTALFHRSIRDNIAYGSTVAPSKDEVIRAAKRAHAHEFITLAPHDYKTEVGERGIKLSMGQRQRIAIARAFLDDKPILVLDEATSALDSESEVLVQRALEDLWQDKTVIAIAHRLSTLRNMDRIVVMHEGNIIESGTHDELLRSQGSYYRLWQHQSGGVITD